MRTKILLPLLLMLISLSGFSKTWTVTNLGSAFTPATITINVGDSVNFSIASTHNVVEVSKSTWDANGNTALPGFSLPFGGGLLLPAELTVGTHYYVCTPHAVWGMKGTIIVQGTTGNAEIKQKTSVSVYPNPSNGLFHIAVSGLPSNKNGNVEIYSLRGEKVFEASVSNSTATIDLSNSSKGIYLMKFNDGEGLITKKIMNQ
jgi:plastocyanin